MNPHIQKNEKFDTSSTIRRPFQVTNTVNSVVVFVTIPGHYVVLELTPLRLFPVLTFTGFYSDTTRLDFTLR